ncbi:uncharacterized protein LOC123554697 isoform X2 [Mercenaria mercenaria]|uniref:uncharacterized protein LOC123554697 isoform X2 n=1 Tax=Mercenaria mercenaria TaxID=6596 RepID=UPI00234FA60A|nr:uncharacterized protein LOC123554697 isoform X2 [Mercenaria mercenaria]
MDGVCKCPVDRTHDDSSDNCTQIDCGDEPVINNGTVTSNGTKYGSTLNITCDEGFELSENATINCTTPGTWGNMPLCTPKECPEFITPNNSEIDSNTTGRTYTDIIEITCITGYELDSCLSTVTCLANQSWSESPVCSVVNCNASDIPVNTIISWDKQKYEYNENVTVECDTGFQLEGNATISCQANGTWEDIPKCSPVDCEPLVLPDNAAFATNKSQLVYQENVTIECDAGYQLQGNATISCQANGTWNDIPKCYPVDCEPLIVPDNAAIVLYKSQFVYNENVTLECDTGYQLQGNATISCQDNGTWINLPECQPVKCEEFTKPDNAAISPNKQQYEYTDNITIECNDGYKFQGENTFSCLANGSWTGVPTCTHKECHLFVIPENAESTPNKSQFLYSENVTIKCNIGYELQGIETISCQTDGTWKEVPTCSPVECELFDVPNKAKLEPDKQQYTYSETVTLECGSGYEIQGNSTVRCQENASWTEIPTCKPIDCSTLQLPEHAEKDLNITGLNFDDAVFITCENGFILVGDSNISCYADGTWPTMKCVPVNCSTDDFAKPDNSMVSNVSDSAFEIECVEGYIIEGNSSVTCISGNWSEFPRCNKVDCGAYGFIENGNVSSETGTKYGDTVEILCIEHFRLIGKSQGICLSNGSWTDKPECTIIECGTLRIPENAEEAVNINDTIEGTVITLVCRDGYDLNGNGTVICQANESWSDIPMCEPKDCGQPNETTNGNFIGLDKTTFNSSFVVECMDGYNLIGEHLVYCQENGSWSGVPMCEPKDCGQIEPPENGSIVNQSGSTVDSVAFIVCDSGFDVVGKENVTCLTSGNWDNLPSCQKTDCGTYTPPDHTNIGTNNTIICEIGYDLSGDAIIECLDGNWSVNGNCDRVQCSNLPEIDNANILENDNDTYLFEDTIDITCNEGFEISGDFKAKCSENKTWVNVPSCNPVTCNEFHVPPDVEIGNQDTTSRVFEDIINITCSIGFELEGDGFVFCNASGDWENNTSCKPKTCPEFEVPNNTKVESSDVNGSLFVFGDSVIFSCEEGYNLTGNPQANCTADGEWTAIPSCSIVSCKSFQVPQNASVGQQNLTGYTYGDALNITCDEGHFSPEGLQAVCGSDGEWVNIPNCVPVNCSKFTVPNNASIGNQTTDGYKFGDVVQVSCQDGFSLSGVSKVECLANGTWGEFPSCEIIDCGPYEPRGETYTIEANSTTTYNTSLSVTCVAGLELTNDSMKTVSCEADGQWNGHIECKIPGSVSFTQSMFIFDEGETKHITCEVKDYPGWQTVYLTKNDQDDSVPFNPIFMISNSTGSVNHRTIDTNYTVDHTLESDGVSVSLKFETVTCDNEGLYTCAVVVGDPANATEMKSAGATVNVSCTDCGIHEPITNTYVVDQNGETTLNSSLSVTCVDGLELTNESVKVVICEADGKWHGEPVCAIPGSVLFTENIYAFDEGQIGHIICEVKDNLRWQTVLLAKEDQDESGPTTPIFMISNATGSISNETLDTNYIVDFTLENDGVSVSLKFETVTCDNEGLYTCAAVVGDPANATEIKSTGTILNISCTDCGIHEPITNTYVVDQNGETTINSTLSVTCVDGLQLTNESVKVVTCEADGKWHGEPDCTIPGSVSFTQTVYAFDEGDTGRITCEVKDYPRWQTVLLAKEDQDDSGPITPIFKISNANGSIYNETLNTNYTVDFTLENDGVSVSLKFLTVTCDNEGLYTCAAVVGDPANATEIKSTGTILNVSCTDCGIHEPITNTYVVDQNGEATINSTLSVTCVDGLQLTNESVKVVTCEADGKWHGEPDCAIPGSVSFARTVYTFDEGDTGRITCEVKDYPRWQTVLLAKEDQDDSGPTTPIFMISNANGSIYNETLDTNYTVDYTLENDGVSVSLKFETVTCNSEGLYTCAAVVGDPQNPTEIKSNGAILNVSCTDCGIHEPVTNTYVVDQNGNATFNSSLSVTCVDGLELTNESVKVVTCEADGNWHGEPVCAIPGSLSFTEKNYAFKEGASVNVTCQMKDNPNWKTLIIGKVDDKIGDLVSQIFTISNVTGSVVHTTFDNNYTASYTLNKDGAAISLQFNPVTCDNEGLYMCTAIVGELESPVEISNTSTMAYITTDSATPEITIPDKVLIGREAEVECTGLIGKGESGQPVGRLLLETNFGDNGSNVTYNGSDTPEEMGCYFKDSFSVLIPTSTVASDLWAQCVIRPLQGDDLLSEKKDIHILASFVAFKNSSYVFNIGEKASIACDVQNVPDWKRIEIRRSDGQVIIGINSTDQSPDSNEPHISLVADESNFANDTATLAVGFDAVMCSDAMGDVGDINYTCAVMTSNSTTEDMTTVTYQRKPEVPILEMSREIIENKFTLGDRLFYCKGDVGDPPGTIEVQSNFNGSYETFLAPLPGIDNNTIGWIVSNETDSSECTNYKTIGFAFHTVTIDMQYKRLRCTIRPSDKLTATMDDLFDDKPINIVSDDICVGKAGYVSHPYFCHLFVECDKTTDGHIVGVPVGCSESENECFDDEVVDGNPCVECSSIGGCNITGIKCDKTYAASYKGETVSFTCDTQDFGEVRQISVNNYAAFEINVTEMTIPVTKDVDVKVSEGSVILSFSNVSCNQEGDYVISLNNQTAITHSLVVISEPTEPNLSVPGIMTANQETKINCSGRIGRDKEGNNKAVIYLEVMPEQSSEFEEYSDHETRASSEEDCEISESVVFSITPGVSLNNSQVRCTAKNDTGVVTYSSPKLIVLQTPAMFCEPMLQARGIGESVLFICALKDITNITSVVVTKNSSTLINEVNVALPYKKEDTPFTLTIPSVTEVNMTFTAVSCEEEGDYDIMLNDAVSATLTLRVVSPATEPSLNKPSKVRLNERLEISCSGDIGRDQDGNAATNMFLEVKFMNESEFSIYNKSVEQDPAVLENCRYTQTVRLIFYPDVRWNNSEVRCAARNETNVVQSSTKQAIKLDSPSTYFETTILTGIVGESVILTCIVDGVDGLTGITITRGTDRDIVASYPGDSNSDSVTVVTEESNLNDSSGVLMINMTVQCGDDGDYFCTSKDSGNPAEDNAVLSVQWKPQAPVLDPSSDMVENSDPWAGLGFETRCTGELGSQNASIYLESNVDGKFKVEVTSLVSAKFNLEQCSNIATIKFDNKYTTEWNGTIIRCVIKTEEEKLMDAEYVTVVPETFCEGHAQDAKVVHPFDCRALLTCGGSRITAYRQAECEVEECYDSNTLKCVPCEDVGKCRVDPLEDDDTTTTPAPGTPYMSCSDAVGWMSSEVSINCTLHNITVESLADAIVFVSNSSGQIFDATVLSPSTSTNDRASYILQDAIAIIIEAAQIKIQFLPVVCSHDGDYTVVYNGTSLVQSTGTLSVQSLPTNPYLSKTPERFYLGSEMAVSCSGAIGNPKGQLTLKTRASSNDTFSLVAEADLSGQDNFDDGNCTYLGSIAYTFYVTSDIDGHEFICETSDSYERIYASDVETINVDEAAIYFTVEEDSAEINTSKNIRCILTGEKGSSGAVISWSFSKDSPVVEICRSDSSNAATCSVDGISILASDEDTNKTIELTIQSVSCNNSGIYYCEPADDGSIKSRMKLDVTREPSAPAFEMQSIVIDSIQTDKYMICSGHVGYPVENRTLKIQTRSAGSNDFEDFDINSFETEESTCTEPAELRKIELSFDLQSYNNTEFRCGLFENNDPTPILVSNNKTLLVLEYPCLEGNTTTFYYKNTFDCHGYILCYSNGVALGHCSAGTCTNITTIPSTAPFCNFCDDTCNFT